MSLISECATASCLVGRSSFLQNGGCLPQEAGEGGEEATERHRGRLRPLLWKRAPGSPQPPGPGPASLWEPQLLGALHGKDQRVPAQAAQPGSLHLCPLWLWD